MTLHIPTTTPLAHFKVSLVNLGACDCEEQKRETSPANHKPARVIKHSLCSPFPLFLPHNTAQLKMKRLIGFSAVNWTSPLLGPLCQDPRIPFEFKAEMEAGER